MKAAAPVAHPAEVSALPTVSFLGLQLARITADEFIIWTVEEARRRLGPRIVGYLNASTVNQAFESPRTARVFASLDCLYADGQAVVWASRWLGEPVPERVNAADFVESFMRAGAAKGLRIGLLGGKEGEAAEFATRFKSLIPGLDVVFVHRGYFAPGAETESILAELEAVDPDIVLVGMGAPRQEELALELSQRGRPRVWWCVGALFEYFSGSRARAPVWMRRAGLEWIFRLALEPGRLWRRYLIGNPKFIYRVVRSAPVSLGSGPSADSGSS